MLNYFQSGCTNLDSWKIRCMTSCCFILARYWYYQRWGYFYPSGGHEMIFHCGLICILLSCDGIASFYVLGLRHLDTVVFLSLRRTSALFLYCVIFKKQDRCCLYHLLDTNLCQLYISNLFSILTLTNLLRYFLGKTYQNVFQLSKEFTSLAHFLFKAMQRHFL